MPAPPHLGNTPGSRGTRAGSSGPCGGNDLVPTVPRRDAMSRTLPRPLSAPWEEGTPERPGHCVPARERGGERGLITNQDLTPLPAVPAPTHLANTPGSGGTRSPFHGFSVEFAQHPREQGDEGRRDAAARGASESSLGRSPVRQDGAEAVDRGPPIPGAPQGRLNSPLRPHLLGIEWDVVALQEQEGFLLEEYSNTCVP